MRTRVESNTSVQTSSIRAIGTAALSAIAVFTALLALMHLLRTDLNPVERMMSEYAVGDYGFLMTLAFLVMAVAVFALMTGLTQTSI
jgi:hypothetical protein